MTDAASSLDTDESEFVVVEVPASTGHLRLVRLLVSSLATSYGADVDDLEDLRIATGEICAQVINAAADGDRLVARAEVRVAAPDRIDLVVRATVPGLADPGPLDDLSSMVLDAASEEHGLESDGSGTTAWFGRTLHPVD